MDSKTAMQLIAISIRMALALVFIIAGASKSIGWKAFRQDLANYD